MRRALMPMAVLLISACGGPGAEGDACGEEAQPMPHSVSLECEEGLVCNRAGSGEPVCTRRVAEGGGCEVGQGYCVEGLVCMSSTDNPYWGRCAPPGEPGAACLGNLQCASPWVCVILDRRFGPSGEEEIGSCREQPGPGEHCDSNPDCAEGVCNYGFVPSLCQLPLGVGEPCALSEHCEEGLMCDRSEGPYGPGECAAAE